jgi:hypothetical protein
LGHIEAAELAIVRRRRRRRRRRMRRRRRKGVGSRVQGFIESKL